MKIDQLLIRGFKRFEKFEIKFNDTLTIIVGENEVGKSTILEALDIVLNKRLFMKEDTSLVRYFNRNEISRFWESGQISALPKIEIDVDLDLDNEIVGLNFSGIVNRDNKKEEYCGIHFEFCFDEEFINQVDISECAKNKIIPIEYYRASWNTYSGKLYRTQMLPLKSIFLDNSQSKNNLYGSYARKIYVDKISEDKRRNISSVFNAKLAEFKQRFESDLIIQNNRSIGLDVGKTDICNLLDVYEDEISVQDMGKGKENIVKTEIALTGNAFDVICIEEPESHLSHSNTRILVEFINQYANEQLILTSHSSMIANRLNISNIIWVSESNSYSLKNLAPKTAEYFQKIDNLDILKFILSNKVILVEGAAEYILLPIIFEQLCGKTLNEVGVEVISMGSISYRHYHEICKQLNDKKVAVITDNDGDNDKNVIDDNFAIFSDDKTENWTLEVAFYNLNKEYFDNLYEKRKTEAAYKGKSCPKALAHMLKNKTENALMIENKVAELEIPKYIKDALKWIKE